MLEATGKYGTAIIYNDEVESEAIAMTIQMMNSPAFEGAKVRIMPDVHAGKGAVIGFTSTYRMDRIIPNVIGVDIGCGVYGWNLGKLGLKDTDFRELDEFIRTAIPYGFNINSSDTYTSTLPESFVLDLKETCKMLGLDLSKVLLSIGSLGGGNHFIELNKDSNDNVWLVIHSGSRNFGLRVAEAHQKVAWATSLEGEKVSKELAHLRNYRDCQMYFDDMRLAQHLADFNRKEMAKRIIEDFFDIRGIVNTGVFSVHNYIDFNDGIIRKGAISAKKGESVLIPLNMAEGTILGVGKGNPDWNYSAPHGAGRTYSRGRAKRELSLDTFREKMSGVWSSCISKDTLDESPMAYKDARKIEELLVDTVEVVDRLKPIYNFKAN